MEQVKCEEIKTPKWFLVVHVASRILFFLAGSAFAASLALAVVFSGDVEANIALPFMALLAFAAICVANTVIGFKKGWLLKRNA